MSVETYPSKRTTSILHSVSQYALYVCMNVRRLLYAIDLFDICCAVCVSPLTGFSQGSPSSTQRTSDHLL